MSPENDRVSQCFVLSCRI